MHLAMWSGPRTLSTALLRSWGNRADTVVADEPLYAHYLLVSGRQDPGREQILAAHESDWQRVAEQLTGPIPAGRSIFYQKHMAQHLTRDVDRAWLGRLTHAFLIRDPAEVVVSYARVRPDPRPADLGYGELVELHRRFGGPVLDAADLLADPAGMLAALCAALGVTFDPAMLSWPPGRRPTDGAWAPYWYAAVEASTGFGPSGPPAPPPPPRLAPLVARLQPAYRRLFERRLRPAGARAPGPPPR